MITITPTPRSEIAAWRTRGAATINAATIDAVADPPPAPVPYAPPRPIVDHRPRYRYPLSAIGVLIFVGVPLAVLLVVLVTVPGFLR